MIVRVGDTKFLAKVTETIVSPAPSDTDIVRSHTRLVQYVRTEVMRPVDHAIFQASLVEGIEKQSKGINDWAILRALRYPEVEPIFRRDLKVEPHISLIHVVVTSSGVDEVV
jgi:hypothetical protein